ncbi:MAG: cell division protein FtsQ/DivIB [Alphaproteobacteria bacterium]|nr:cell division protein FtsQ/DivIB [Alphaproteobacteria bacterium]
MKRNLWFWLYFIAAILLAIYFATRIIMTFMGYGPISTVRNISISADTKNKDLTQMVAATGVSPGTNAYSVNLELVNERLLNTPGVRESAVRRMPNGNLSVRVHLYRAVAGWTDGTYYYPLSADGTVVNSPSEEQKPGVVMFRGPLPNDISQITKAATNLIGELDYIEWIDDRRWNIVTTGGITVMLPESDPVAAIASLIVLNDKHNILSKNLKTIDMRDSARILVK